MKKYFPMMLLALLSFVAFSCSTDRNDNSQNTDHDTYPKMRDIRGNFNAANEYTISQDLNIASTDVVLVYRNNNSSAGGSAVWQLLPDTVYFDSNKQIKYSFLFNNTAVEIYADANVDPSTLSAAQQITYLNNQQFRIVLVPASQGKGEKLDYSDYNSVIRYYNLDDSNVKTL